MAALLLPDGEEVLYGTPEHPDHLVWFGPREGLTDHAAAAGFGSTAAMADLGARIEELQGGGVTVQYLPPYRPARSVQLSNLFGLTVAEVAENVSQALIRAVVAQRSIKTAAEVAEIEEALTVTAGMYSAAMRAAGPGRSEAEVAAALRLPALANDRQLAFLPIVTVHGEVLHNESYANTLQDGQLLLVDSGAESARFYASDVTRTFPVSGRFLAEQRDIYRVVLRAQLEAIAAASPGRTNRDVHLSAARATAEGLRELGLMQGDVDEAVAEGAHALFFPHGIGHMLGLDVHDMEDLGDAVGYPEGEPRSEQFGLGFLRLAKPLEPGFVITIEPGVYFIPALIDRWQAEGRHTDFIRYDRLEPFKSFGGIRIEDDVLITDAGSRVLGPPIPKTVDEIEGVLG